MLKPKYIIFFVWMLIIPAAISYFGGWDTALGYLFVLKAFSVACLATVVYYLIERKLGTKRQ